VDSCETKGGRLVVRYSGLNKGQHELLDPSAITLFINSDQRTNLMGVASVPGGEYAFAGADRYTLSFPLVTNEHVASVGVAAARCKADFQPTKSMVRCDQPAKAAPAAPPAIEEEPAEPTETPQPTVIEPVRETALETAPAASATLPAPATEPIEEPVAADRPTRTRLIITLPSTTTLILIGIIAILAIIIAILVVRGRSRPRKVIVVEEKGRR
jgi:hypothetical protein